MIALQISPKIESLYRLGQQATLNFRKFKVALKLHLIMLITIR